MSPLSLQQTTDILCGPGQMHEMETRLVDGQLLRVYKNLWPSLRIFWLWAANEHKDALYTVFEGQRYTFSYIFARSLKAAAMFYDVYGVRKGDRVAICARNYPEYLVAFWAIHLLGAISALPNAWSPLITLQHCITHTQAKLIIVDAARADILEPVARALLANAGASAILVLEPREGKGAWENMSTWDDALAAYTGDPRAILSPARDPAVVPEDDATILFTSGTTGMPKGVLSTQRQFLTNILNVLVGGRRAALRRGEEIPGPPIGPQRGILLSVPLFHVTGLTSLTMLATMAGLKIVMMRKWVPEEGARLIKNENIAIAGGVPSMVADLTDASAPGKGDGKPNFALESLMFGGAPAPDSLAARAHAAFPAASMSQGYGLTETSSVAVGFAGEDYIARPKSCGLATPVNDILIVKDGVAQRAGDVGEVWLRGPNVMKGYWRDPAATAKALTRDGWFRTGDLGVLDEEGFLYIRDRIKDIIIRGGENIDSVTVENALYADTRVLEVAAVGVPDARLGELVAAVVSVKPAFRSDAPGVPSAQRVTEAALIALAATALPRFAVPVMIVVQDEPFERTPSGKILKADLRKVAAAAYAKRIAAGASQQQAKL